VPLRYPWHSPLSNLSIIGYGMGERLVELDDRVATPQNMLGADITFSKTPPCRVFSSVGRSCGPPQPHRVVPPAATLLRFA
jgi:hypothetical protein